MADQTVENGRQTPDESAPVVEEPETGKAPEDARQAAGETGGGTTSGVPPGRVGGAG